MQRSYFEEMKDLTVSLYISSLFETVAGLSLQPTVEALSKVALTLKMIKAQQLCGMHRISDVKDKLK